ncbi:TPA: hypothetical protein ACU18W_001623 [Mannheimia haemolytica]
MTDTKRLDFIEKHKMEIRYADIAGKFVIGSYEAGGFFHWSKNADLRTAIDEAMKEMRGLSNATTN